MAQLVTNGEKTSTTAFYMSPNSNNTEHFKQRKEVRNDDVKKKKQPINFFRYPKNSKNYQEENYPKRR